MAPLTFYRLHFVSSELVLLGFLYLSLGYPLPPSLFPFISLKNILTDARIDLLILHGTKLMKATVLLLAQHAMIVQKSNI